MEGERQPGIDCLRMCDHSQKDLGIHLRLEIVGKINTYTSDILPYHERYSHLPVELPSTP